MTTIDICRKCYSKNTSCCTLRPDNKEKMMIPPVSEPEIDRILNFFENKKCADLCERKHNSTFYLHQMLNLFPGMEKSVFEAFPEGEKHFELKTINNACILLGSTGCRLPQNIRPHFCRIYPFWIVENTPHTFQDSDCLALKVGNTLLAVFLAMGTNFETTKQIHSQICQDWGIFRSLSQTKKKLSLTV